MQWGALVRAKLHPQHANLVVFEFKLVMLWIHLEWIERSSCALSSARFLQLHFHQVCRFSRDKFRAVQTTRRAPLHLACFKMQDRLRLPIVIGEFLRACLQVNHDPIDRVLVHVPFNVRFFGGIDNPNLIVIDGRRSSLSRNRRCDRKKQQREKM